MQCKILTEAHLSEIKKKEKYFVNHKLLRAYYYRCTHSFVKIDTQYSMLGMGVGIAFCIKIKTYCKNIIYQQKHSEHLRTHHNIQALAPFFHRQYTDPWATFKQIRHSLLNNKGLRALMCEAWRLPDTQKLQIRQKWQVSFGELHELSWRNPT